MGESQNSRNVSVIKDADGNNIVMINDIRFKGVSRFMLIRCANDGKLYLYDIIDIKKETSNPLG
jgi:hypothetical protein